MKKNAFLIMCHKNSRVLTRLVRCLDSADADIYVHVDKKAKGFDRDALRAQVRRSELIFIESKPAYWGGYSQIDCELRLLEAACARGYSYYHSLSGEDLPVRPMHELNALLDAQPGTIYCHPHNVPVNDPFVLRRLQLWNPFLDMPRNSRLKKEFIRRIAGPAVLGIQKALHIDRTKKMPWKEFVKTDSWFSLPHDAAMYVLSQKDIIEKYFKNTSCADEVFLATVLRASPLRSAMSDKPLRYIKWVGRSHPETLGAKDADDILTSGCFFARKFDEHTDPALIDRLTAGLEEE